MAIRRTSTLNNITVDDPKTTAALRQVVTAMRNLEEDASLNTGLVFATIASGVTATRVRHNLGHKVLAWDIVDKNAVGDVFRVPDADESNYISLKTSATVGVTLRLA